MADITISSFSYALAQGTYTTGSVKLRVWYTGCYGGQFIDSLGAAIPCGVGSGTSFFKEVSCTVASNVITVPAFVLPSTDDSDTNNVVATAQFWVSGAPETFLFSSWIITNILGATVSFAQLRAFNLAASLPTPLWDRAGVAFLTANIFTDTQTINPPALSTHQGLVITQTSPTTGSTVGPLNFNTISVNNQLNVTTPGVGDPFAQYYAAANKVTLTEGGSNVQGFQVAQYVRLNHIVGTSNISATNASDHIALLSIARSNQDGGSSGLYGGDIVAQAASGAVHGNLVALELGTELKTGAIVTTAIGLRINFVSDINGTGNTDAAITIKSRDVGAASWQKLISFGQTGQAQALKSDADFFYSHQTMTVANIFNLSNVTVSGNIMNFPNFTVTGAGAVGVGAITNPLTDAKVQIQATDATGFSAVLDGYGAAASIIGRRAAGTSGSPTATAADSPVLILSGRGYHTSGSVGFTSNSIGSFKIHTDTIPTSTDWKSYATIYATPAGSTTSAEVFRVAGSGDARLPLGDLSIITQGKGLVLRDTDGAGSHRITVNTAGTITAIAV